MTLPAGFRFSQGSLQDYVDCPRRFELRYLLRLAWPAEEAEPALENERHMRLGAAFHRLAHQHALGIEAEQISRTATNAGLGRWWQNYLERGPTDLPETRYPEIVLAAPVGDHRLIAKYDLVAVDAGERAVIVDWKTSRKRPRRGTLARRMQSRVYPYLLVRAGAHLNGNRPLAPEQVSMIYWFAEHPDESARFAYDGDRFQADEAELCALIDEIGRLDEGGFPLTADDKHCKFCPYRSLCRRGIEAGDMDAREDEDEAKADDWDIDLDLEQIAEVEY